jgi:hypothetical protein
VTDAAHGASEEHLAARTVSPGQAIYRGIRQPIVLMLLLIAFFTTVTGKPLDGFLMLTVAVLLGWDAVRGPERHYPDFGLPARMTQDRTVQTRPGAAGATGRGRLTRRQLAGRLSWCAAALAYAGVVGSFKRYSWPATIPVVLLGCLAVAIGWQGPLRQRAALTGRALRRAWAWGVVLVAGGLWELSSLLQQPHLTTDSYSHPTISALSDPLLASHPGRTVTLGAWLLIGYFLVER